MDNSYGGSDETVLRATPSHHHTPYIDTLLITPSIGANMQLSHGLYEAASRVKCEDMASGLTGMISWATASQLYENIQFSDTLRSKSHSTACDLWLRSAPMPLCVPAFDTMDFVASNPFQFLSTSEHMVPSMDTSSISSTRSDKGLQLYEPEADFKPAKNPGATSRLSKSMVQALELQNAQTGKYLGPSFLSTTTTLLKPSAECIPASSHTHPIIPSDISPDMVASLSDSPNSPSKQDSSVLSAEDSDADRTKIQSQSSKRRKTQQKRIVCVPIGDGKQKVEAPPSDLWAWRKYGQKPIKGSPYPRGYYRCSSSKGCSARKQVERSCTDPTMLIVTYTSDHDHPWPANRSMKSAIGPKPSQSGDKCQGQAEEAANSCEVACENLFSSIINSPNAVNEQVVSPLDSLQDEESFSLHRDVDLRFLSRTTTEEDDVFDDLGELPNLSAIFNKGYLEEKLMDDGCEQYGSCKCLCSMITRWVSS